MATKDIGKPQITPHEPEHINSRRDPEERTVMNDEEAKEKAMDKTLADSFPTSDPPSSIPAPCGDDTGADDSLDNKLAGLPEGSWAALSIGDKEVIGLGATQEEATERARQSGHTEMSLVRVTGEDEDEHILDRAS
ncbi:MAG TPA: hypothetical protein VLK33_08160 [Terriglobales bacterium]|nr:hypothetical protein [Terriglobales bacterium]